MSNNIPASCPIVGVGASAGGLEALNELLANVGSDAEMAFVIVQHLDPTHESMMAELIDRKTGIKVEQIVGGEQVQPGHGYVIPPGYALTIKDGRLEITKFSEPRGMRRPIDDFFLSLAHDQQGNAACVILSGTGADGSVGLRGIKERGGICVAQQPDTAKYDGMPMSAVATGLVDFILPPEDIYERLQAFFALGSLSVRTKENSSFISDNIEEICTALRTTVGHDFSGYKHSTLTRRIERRMQVLEIERADHYLKRLKSDSRECEALLQDLLINVTSFFRDKPMFEELRDVGISRIIAQADASDTIRVWVAGCSSGEEAYTIAMIFADELKDIGTPPAVQIFATDIDQQMLTQAREGRYSLVSLRDVPEKLREAYIFARDGHFQVTPHIRDMIHFSNHSLIKDPPFSKLDLVSCRNLLIYLGDRIQSAVIPLFHYALKEDGILFLGSSESIGRRTDLFSEINQKYRIYSRLPGRVPYPIDLPMSLDPRPIRKRSQPFIRRGDITEENEPSIANRRLLERYAPANILITEEGEILSSNGKLSKYLEFPTGTPTTHILALARKGFREVLSPLLREVAENGRRQAVRGVEVDSEFGTQVVDVIVDPLSDGTMLIILPETEDFRAEVKEEYLEPAEPEDRVNDLEEELRMTRFRLRSTVEELETANEELKSSNEEMMSMNEELQSANEELSTVNEEIKNKADQLSVANEDMRHFLESTELALIVLDHELNVKTFTDPITEIFPLKTSDRGRSLSEVANMLDDGRILSDAKKVAEGGEIVQRLVTHKDGELVYSMRMLPFRTFNGAIEGVTLTFTDVSQLRGLEDQLQIQTDRLRIALSAAGIGVWDFNTETGETNVDAKVCSLFGIPPQSNQTMNGMMDFIHPDDRDRVTSEIETAIRDKTDFRCAFRVVRADDSIRWLQGAGRLEKGMLGQKRMFGINFDITAERAALENNELLLGEMNHRIKNLFAIISSIVSLAGRSASDIPTLVENIVDRIEGLGRAHVATQHGGDVASSQLSQIVETVLEPYKDLALIKTAGADIQIKTDDVTPIGLILHEWATNSKKYGALTTSTGLVDIKWSIQRGEGGEEEIVIEWNESGGPKVITPQGKTGFGTRLISGSAAQLDGHIDVDWNPAGVNQRLHFTTGNDD